MIGRKSDQSDVQDVEGPKGFDDYQVRLGDVMRGERATLGKSLLDVQRELRIKASYISAIENCDPDAFDTPGFIAGYVRSYARYLNMDPEQAFDTFCAESGFEVSHGMSAQASSLKKTTRDDRKGLSDGGDIFSSSAIPFTPERDSIFKNVEPGAIGSSLVLLTLIGAIGFGGWSVLQEVQRVQEAPVEQTPIAWADLDPIEPAVAAVASADAATIAPDAAGDAVNRLYRPPPLEQPVLTPRDGPIITLDPRDIGNFAELVPDITAPTPFETAEADRTVPAPPVQIAAADGDTPSVPQVVEEAAPSIQMVAVRDSWVRVRAADGTVIFEKVMRPGESWEVPLTEDPVTLRTGNSGGIYFAMRDAFYGPVGESGKITSGLALDMTTLETAYNQVEIESDAGLVRYAEAQGLIVAD